MSFRRLSSLGVAATLTFGMVSAVAAAQKHAPLSADQIKMMVEHKLSEVDELHGVTVAVEGHTVTLRGTVPSLWAKEKAVSEANEVPDVEAIVSELSIPAVEDDEMLARDVARKVRQYVFYTVFDNVDIGVQSGVVTLMGKVLEPYRSSEIAKMVSRVRGVKEIDNQIEVLPVSIYDNQIRAELASRIYNDTVLSRYAFQVDPPIHIIVEHGRVTLTGVVNSEVERRVAETIARQVFGVFSVENKLRLDRELSTRG